MKNFTRFIAALAGICLLALSFSSCEKDNITTTADAPTLRTLDEIVQVTDVDKSDFYEYSVTGEEIMNILGDEVDPNLSVDEIARQFAKLVQDTYLEKTGQKITKEQLAAKMPIFNHRMTTIRFNFSNGSNIVELIGFRGFISTLFTNAFDDRASRNYFPNPTVLVTTYTDINDQNGPVAGLGASDSTADKTCVNGPGPISIFSAKYWRVRNRVTWSGSAFTETSAVITCGRIRRLIAVDEEVVLEDSNTFE